MTLILLADVSTYALFGAALALILLLVFQIRLAKRHEGLEEDLERLEKAQKQQAIDARTRTEEVTRAVDRLAEEVHPKLEAFAPDVQRMGTRLDAFHAKLEEFQPRTEEAERRVESVRGSAEEARARAEAAEKLAEKLAQEHAERLTPVQESLGRFEQRLAALAKEQEHAGSTLAARLERAEAEVAKLRAKLAEVAESAPRTPARDDTVGSTDTASPTPQATMHAARTRAAEGRAVEATKDVPTDVEPEPVLEAIAETGEDDVAARDEAAVDAVTRPVAPPAFQFEASEEDDHVPGTRGLLTLVIVLALLTLGFSLFGIGR